MTLCNRFLIELFIFWVPQYSKSDITLCYRFRSEPFKVNYMAETSEEDFGHSGAQNLI